MMNEQWKSFEEWMAQVPENMRRDPLWNFQVYPKTLFLADLVWKDTDQMMENLRGRETAKQLIRSAGSICANIRRRTWAWFWQRQRLLSTYCSGVCSGIKRLVLSGTPSS